MNLSGGKLVAWAGFGFGSVVSIAANVLHAWLPDEPPTVAAQLGAAVWPIALLLSVEAISRVRWRSGWWWNFARFGGLGVVGLGSFAISYGHLYEVLAAWGYTELGAAVGPIVIDGLMVISGFALLSESGARTQPAAQTTPKPKQWVVAEVEKKADGSQTEHVVEAPAAKVSPIGDPKPWSIRAKQLMDDGVSRATAYRQAKKEFESVSA